jgi:transposase
MERKAYPSDLTDAQWRLIAPLIPDAKPGGRPRKYESLFQKAQAAALGGRL